MKKFITKLSQTLATTLVIGFLSGCVVIINNNKPTGDEQTLMNIQNQASQEVSKINQQIQAGNQTKEQIQAYIQQAEAVVTDSLKKIDSLNLPERSRALADKTKEYLQKVDQTYRAFLQMTKSGTQKMQEIIDDLKTMSQPLMNMAQQMQSMQTQFMNAIKAASSQNQGTTQATAR